MRIVDFRLQTIGAELKHPFVTNLRRVDAIEDVLLTLICEDGSFGYGEAPPTVAITGEDLVSIKETIANVIFPAIKNVEIENSQIFENLNNCIKKSTSAKACVDMAIYDLLSKHASKPLYEYLGGQNRPIKTNLTISLTNPIQMLEDSIAAYEEGFEILKIKVGPSMADSIEAIRLIRNALPQAILRVDANQAWDENKSLQIIDNIYRYDVELIEQPVVASDLRALKNVTANSSIPILADEAVFTPEDARVILEERVADFINIKLMKSGGIYNALKILQIAKEYDSKVMMGSMLESVVSISAGAHFGMLDETIAFFDLDGPLLAKESAINHPMIFSQDTITIKNCIGLGISF